MTGAVDLKQQHVQQVCVFKARCAAVFVCAALKEALYTLSAVQLVVKAQVVYVSPQHGQHGVLAVVQHISEWLEGAMAGPAGCIFLSLLVVGMQTLAMSSVMSEF